MCAACSRYRTSKRADDAVGSKELPRMLGAKGRNAIGVAGTCHSDKAWRLQRRNEVAEDVRNRSLTSDIDRAAHRRRRDSRRVPERRAMQLQVGRGAAGKGCSAWAMRAVPYRTSASACRSQGTGERPRHRRIEGRAVSLRGGYIGQAERAKRR